MINEKKESKSQPPMVLKNDSVTIVLPEGPKLIRKGQSNFLPLVEAIKEEDWDKVIKLCNVEEVVKQNLKGTNIEIVGNQILLNGDPLSGYLVNKILAAVNQGFPVQHLLKFLQNLQMNPSMRARDELYAFLETEDLPVTEDGCFLAYKAVRSNFLDKHSGTIDNSVGRVVSLPRSAVDDDQSRGCSKGLHAGSLSYVKGFGSEACGDVFLIVKINPMDVVCIPSEDVRKLRCCKYEVVTIMKGELVYHSFREDGVTPVPNSQKTSDDSNCQSCSDDWEDSDESIWEDCDLDWQD
jgi:hypothetical protein